MKRLFLLAALTGCAVPSLAQAGDSFAAFNDQIRRVDARAVRQAREEVLKTFLTEGVGNELDMAALRLTTAQNHYRLVHGKDAVKGVPVGAAVTMAMSVLRDTSGESLDPLSVLAGQTILLEPTHDAP